jgi:hypothetical protein
MAETATASPALGCWAAPGSPAWREWAWSAQLCFLARAMEAAAQPREAVLEALLMPCPAEFEPPPFYRGWVPILH